MKTSIFNNIFIEEPKGPSKGLPEGVALSIKLETILDGLITNYFAPSCYSFSSLCLFEGCGGFSTISSMPSFDIAHDTTWDDFGRAYYSSCDYHLTEFHCTLYSVDEIKQQIEAKMRHYERNCIMSVPCAIMKQPHSSLLDRYFAENPWDEDLYVLIEDFKARNVYARNLWVTDDHSCRPFDNTSIYLHQLAKLSLSVQNAPTSAASRPCCRSFLMASCRQLSGDDLLGH